MSVFHELLAVTCQEFLYIVSRVELILDGKMIYIKLLGRPRKCKINLWPVFQPQALCFDSFCLFKTIWFYPVRWKYKLAIIKRFQSLALRQSETPQFVSKLTHLSDVFVFLGYPWRPTTSLKKNYTGHATVRKGFHGTRHSVSVHRLNYWMLREAFLWISTDY